MTWWRGLSLPWKVTVVIAVLTAVTLGLGPPGAGFSNDPTRNLILKVIIGVALNSAIAFVVTWAAVWIYRQLRRGG